MIVRRVVEDGRAFFHSDAEDTRTERHLCLSCGARQECGVFSELEDAEAAEDVGIIVSRCPHYEQDHYRGEG